jgi:hypothetical protein
MLPMDSKSCVVAGAISHDNLKLVFLIYFTFYFWFFKCGQSNRKGIPIKDTRKTSATTTEIYSPSFHYTAAMMAMLFPIKLSLSYM